MSAVKSWVTTSSRTGKKILTPHHVVEVVETILPAQSKYREIGVMLGLPTHVLDAIDHKFHNHGQPDRLLQVILMFLKQTEIPTWRLIIDALRSPTVNFLQLAKEVETAHFHNSTLEAIPQTTHGIY